MVEFAHGDGVGMTEEVEALPFGWPEVSPMAAAWYGMGPFWPTAGRPNRGRARYAGGAQGELGQQGSQKHRFCATFPNIGRCRHGPGCSFAHSREEVTAPLLSAEEEAYAPGALTEEFFTQRFKTLWCPIGAQHDWQACMYAHTYQDVRRPPAIGYGHQLCPFWNKKDTSLPYSQRCPLGPRCPHAHGAKEQLYHPHYFRTLVCRDLQRRRCPRADLCAFYHRQGDCRKVGSELVDYSAPLPKEALPAEWVAYFLNPPRFQEASCDDSLPPMSPAAVMAQALACSGSEWVPGCVPEEWEEETTAEESSEVLAEESEESTDGGLPGGFSSEADCGAALAALSGGGDGSWAASPEAAAAAAAHAEAAAAMQAAVEEAAAWGAMPYLPYSGVYQGFPGCYMDPSAGYAGPPRSGKPGPRLEPIEW